MGLKKVELVFQLQIIQQLLSGPLVLTQDLFCVVVVAHLKKQTTGWMGIL